MTTPAKEARMYPVMGGFLDGGDICHPDDRLDKPGCDWVVLRNQAEVPVYYRYEFWLGIQRWLFDRSSKFITDIS